MIYLASPYTDPNPMIQGLRVRIVSEWIGTQIEWYNYFSPVLYGVSLECHVGGTFYAWQHFNRNMIDRLDSFAVLQIEGWDRSEGVIGELDYAIKQGKSIEYIAL